MEHHAGKTLCPTQWCGLHDAGSMGVDCPACDAYSRGRADERAEIADGVRVKFGGSVHRDVCDEIADWIASGAHAAAEGEKP